MKKLLILFALAAIFSSCVNNNQKKKEATVDKSEECDVMSVDSFLNVAADHVDKVVTVKGTVDHVCKHGGKRVRMFTNNPEVSIHGEATEEVGAFDAQLEGSDICITGPVVESRIDLAYVDEWETKVKEAMENEEEEADMEHKAGADHHATLEKIQDYRKQIEESEKGYISFYAVNVTEYEECTVDNKHEGCDGHDHDKTATAAKSDDCGGKVAEPCGGEKKAEHNCGGH